VKAAREVPQSMPSKLRYISLLTRKIHSAREGTRILRRFGEWRELQRDLPGRSPSANKLLLIRLDDIGDYLLFRNQLRMYKESSRWKDHSITLLGNSSWKEIFATFDKEAVDDTIWVNKNEYLMSASYRLNTWKQLRESGFETVIAPSRTRPLLLDDLCMLAAAPMYAIGSTNTYVHARWNRISDGLYQELFRPSDTMIHEFHFNAHFTAWICGIGYVGGRPQIEFRFHPQHAGPYIICFVGANTKSKRWPVKRWIELIDLYHRQHSGRVILAGNGNAEVQMAKTIEEHTDSESIAGKVSLLELLDWVAGAQSVLTNDTMAAHLSASCDRPTVIIANGVNYMRFTDYDKAGIDNVTTIYPAVFNRRRERSGPFAYHYTDAVSADIASIRADVVLEKLEELQRAKIRDDSQA
jgi:ADP-heptose:LPS heptosyltransferase